MSRKIVKLKEVVNITSGEFLHKQYQNDTEKYPVYNGGVSPTSYYSKYNTEKNKVVVSARGSAGFVNKVETDFWCGNSCFVLNVKDSSVMHWRYLYYAMKNIQEELTSSKKEGVIPSINKKQLEDIEILLPPLAEQQAIVDKLDLLTECAMDNSKGIQKEIELRQKQYEYYLDEWIFCNTDILKLSLSSIAKYSKEKIEGITLHNDNYVGVENLLKNKEGKTISNCVPTKGKVTKYQEENILVGNIRPYLKKIWFSTNVGGASGDVLVFQTNCEKVIPKFLYYALSSNAFLIIL